MPHRLYHDLASWWPLVSPPEDYADDAALYARLLREAADAPPRTLVEFGSGGGHVAVHLKESLSLTLVDPAPAMRSLSEALNPECEHLDGDMRQVRLGRTFDLVLIHDAIVYMTTEADLLAALTTAFVHTAPGGAALFAPDRTTETFRPSTRVGGTDGPDRGLRYLEWTHPPAAGETLYRVDYAFMMVDASGQAKVEHDRHLEGLFPRATWLELLGQVGYEARRVPFDTGDPDDGVLDLFLARRPTGPGAARSRSSARAPRRSPAEGR